MASGDVASKEPSIKLNSQPTVKQGQVATTDIVTKESSINGPGLHNQPIAKQGQVALLTIDNADTAAMGQKLEDFTAVLQQWTQMVEDQVGELTWHMVALRSFSDNLSSLLATFLPDV